MLAVLAHDPDSGLIDYGNANILQKDESAVVLEFLDFYHGNSTKKDDRLRYIVFDSRFTNYENLKKLDQAGIKFITIRRRGKLMIERISELPAAGWKKVSVECLFWHTTFTGYWLRNWNDIQTSRFKGSMINSF